jgi:cyclase
MNDTKRRACAAAAATVGLAAAFVVSAQSEDLGRVTIKTQALGADVYMLSGVDGFAGGNVAVLKGTDGIVLVDAFLEPMSTKLRQALADIGGGPIRFVINTHSHYDHTQGNKSLGREATIVAHENTRKHMSEGTSSNAAESSGASSPLLPIMTFNDRLNLHLNGEEIRAAHYPAAHTDGDTVVYFMKAKVVHLGDTFFNGMYPYIAAGGTVSGLLALLDGVLADLPADAKVIPGHGPVASKTELNAYAAMLRETSQIIERGLSRNKSVQDLQHERVLAAYDEHWGKGYQNSDQFIEQLHNVLRAEQKAGRQLK